MGGAVEATEHALNHGGLGNMAGGRITLTGILDRGIACSTTWPFVLSMRLNMMLNAWRRRFDASGRRDGNHPRR